MTKKIPIKRGFPLIGSSLNYAFDPLMFMQKCQKKYNDIVKVNLGKFPYIYVYNTKLIDEIFRDSENFGKADETSSLLFGRGLLTSEGETWALQRKLTQKVFSNFKISNNYTHFFSEVTKEVLLTLKDGEILDIHQVMSEIALRIIVLSIFGREIQRDMNEVHSQMLKILDYLELSYASPFEIPDNFPLPKVRRFNGAIKYFDEMLYDFIKNNEGAEFVNTLLLEGKGINSPQMIRDQFMTLFIAGHETTALLLTYTLHLLSYHEKYKDELVKQLNDISVDSNGNPDYLEIIKNKYLDAIIKESLRLYPPAYAIIRYTRKDIEKGGYFFPKDNFVLISPYVQHRNPENFDDPLSFKPERWFKGQSEENFIPFGKGKRFCIGKNFSLVESKVILYEFFKAWDCRSLEPKILKLRAALTARPAKGLRVKITKKI